MRISSPQIIAEDDAVNLLRDHICERARQTNKLLVVGIDGRSGAGKTTLAANLAHLLGADFPAVTLFHLEDMYQGWEGLAPAIADWSSLVNQLRESDCGTWTGWDWETSTPLPRQKLCKKQEPVEPAILIGEGVGAFCADIDITCWVERPDHERKAAALVRDGETYRPFWDIWAQQEQELFKTQEHHYSTADFIIRQQS
ncbi:hypothetical protein IDM48_09270 [Rothia amarae]|uniref:Uncharacterized protein n=1 Tax=Rothia amarae TaxID=169480 RepID=A0A7H2BIQ9_9MICC|nr:hypothetical protein [Rothia amarae]QNV39555.1 hypothetical protein IDM48_09270 [Rothia amarae]SIK47829.1 Para-aminobenzoate synthase [Mycobacteroides abscessus subsp. abscessus]